MGFSTSGAVAVVFVGFLLAMGVLIPSVEGGYERTVEARDLDQERALRVANSAIDVSAVDYNATADELTVDVDNAGSVTLQVDRTDLVVDGEYVVPDVTAVEGDPGRTVVAPGERLTLTVEDYQPGPDRVKVVAGTGVADTVTGV